MVQRTALSSRTQLDLYGLPFLKKIYLDNVLKGRVPPKIEKTNKLKKKQTISSNLRC